jgi:hypothetical protein
MLLAAITGIIGALTQHFSILDGLSAAYLVMLFTGLFILLPVWILALIMSWFYKRSKISYDLGRSWVWIVPGLFATLMALYVGIVGEQIQMNTVAGKEDGVGSVSFFFLYLYLGFFTVLISMVVAFIRLFILQEENKKS